MIVKQTGIFKRQVKKMHKQEKSALDEAVQQIILDPSIGEMMDESVDIQGHKICFSTVDLSASEQVIRDQLLELVSNIEMEKIFNARL